MQKYVATIAYDGTEYSGWQVQKHAPSVAQALEDTFLKVFNQSIRIRGVSRTDAGVHALGQRASFTLDKIIDPQSLLFAWNNKLPATIVVRDLQPVLSDYSIFDHVAYKTYWYHFFIQRPLPFFQRFGWFVSHAVDVIKLEESLRVFHGTHDFRSFCSEKERDNTIRTILDTSISWIPEYSAYRIAITGPAFLRYMIRRMVGAGIFVASHPGSSVECIKKALEEKDPNQTLPKAPAQGLVLYKVVYKGQEEIV